MGGPLHLSGAKGRLLHVVGSNKDATKPRRKRITGHAQEKCHVARKSPPAPWRRRRTGSDTQRGKPRPHALPRDNRCLFPSLLSSLVLTLKSRVQTGSRSDRGGVRGEGTGSSCGWASSEQNGMGEQDTSAISSPGCSRVSPQNRFVVPSVDVRMR